MSGLRHRELHFKSTVTCPTITMRRSLLTCDKVSEGFGGLGGGERQAGTGGGGVKGGGNLPCHHKNYVLC